MNKRIQLITSLLFLFVVVSAQIPPKPSPARLVNDFAGIFTPSEIVDLEKALVMIDDSTSNQICVVTVKDLGGYDKAYVAQQIGQTWGIGGKDKNNGIVILIKPKIGNERGEVFIATGYGLEGAIPDAVCNRIIDEEMIPYFKQNDYYGGTVAAVNYLYRLAKGEIDIKKVAKPDKKIGRIFMVIIFVLILIILFSKKNKNNGNDKDGHTSYGGSGALPWILMGGALGGGGGSGGGFSGFGGFGGFGGGGFGGGGAGGSW